MRVILVGNAIPPERVGGLPRYVRELAAALARAGCEVVILAKRVDEASPRIELAPDGVEIIRHAVPSKRNPMFAAAYPFYTAGGVLGGVRAHARRPTVIHAHFPVGALPLALAGPSYLYTFHAPVWRELLEERQGTYVLPRTMRRPAVGVLRAVERLVVRRASATFVLSEFMRSQLRELDEHVAARTRLLPGGVDLNRFHPDPSILVDHGAPLLFTARRFTPRTGVDRLIAAMPDIVRAHPRARLALAGTGEMEAQLRELAAELAVAERIRFLGRVSDESLAEWYRRATLVVMPSVRLEGFGLTAAEALACGTPVLATPVAALPELLGPLDPLLIAGNGTPRGIATAVNRLLGDPSRLRSISERSRARVAPRLGWDAVAQHYIEAYERVTSRSSR